MLRKAQEILPESLENHRLTDHILTTLVPKINECAAAINAVVDHLTALGLDGAVKSPETAPASEAGNTYTHGLPSDLGASQGASQPEQGLPFDVVDEKTTEILKNAGYDSVEKIKQASDEELLAIKGIAAKRLEQIRKATA